MTQKILMVAAPFGFGPSSQALILANGLSHLGVVTICIDGNVCDFVDQFRAREVELVDGRFSQLYPDLAALSCFDLIVSINHLPALNHVAKFDLLQRTVFFDNIYQWRLGNTKDVIPAGLLGYLVQDYPGLGDNLSPALATHVLKTAPVIWPLPSDPPQRLRRRLVLHCGGLTSPLVKWTQVRDPLRKIIKTTHYFARQHGLMLEVIGNPNLKTLEMSGEDLKVRGNVSPEQAVTLFAAAAMVVSTPGMGAIYECLAHEIPVVLLPPMNSTQFHQFQSLSDLGFPSTLPSSVIAQMSERMKGKNWQLQTRICLVTLRANTALLLSGLGEAIATLTGTRAKRQAGASIIRHQREVFRKLSKRDAVAIISDMAQGMKDDFSQGASVRAGCSGRVPDRYFLELPKVELHVHMEGCIRPELMLQLARRNSLRLPFSNAAEFGDLQRFGSFRDFANLLLMGVHCLRQRQDFYDLVVDMGEQMAAQNIIYAEVTWTPQFYMKRGMALDAILSAMNDARAHVRSKWGLDLRWIPDIVRSYPGPSWDIAKWASSEKSIQGGVVALGLGGPESSRSAEFFRKVFEYARNAGLPANPHAGEGRGADGVEETLNCLKPLRLGHGVRAIEEPALLARLIRENITLEVCPTSNIRLGLYPSYRAHPLKSLVEAGCKVTINSDDPILFTTDITNEYRVAVMECGLTPEQLQATILQAARASYLSQSEKQDLMHSLSQRIRQVNDGYLRGGAD